MRYFQKHFLLLYLPNQYMRTARFLEKTKNWKWRKLGKTGELHKSNIFPLGVTI